MMENINARVKSEIVILFSTSGIVFSNYSVRKSF